MNGAALISLAPAEQRAAPALTRQPSEVWGYSVSTNLDILLRLGDSVPTNLGILLYDVEDESTDALAESGEVAEIGRCRVVIDRSRISPVRAVE